MWRMFLLLLCWPSWGMAAIIWMADYEQAHARAQAERMPLFVYFDARWCSWCHRYLDETLADPRLGEYLRRHYVAVKVDWDARPDLVREYRATGLPFTALRSADGEIVNRFVGLVGADDLLARLAADGSGRDDQALRLAPLSAIRPEGVDAAAWQVFSGEWMAYLERLWWPDSGGLHGLFDTGLSLKWPQPMTWLWLEENGLWRERADSARASELMRLWDRHDGGFFNYAEPRAEHVETSKLLPDNAWMAAWYAGATDRRGRDAALSALGLLEGLRTAEGAMYQAVEADEAYYRLPPAQRRSPPPVDRIVRADANGSAVWALACAARRGLPGASELAGEAMDGVWHSLWREGRLHHARRDNVLGQQVWPEDGLYLLAAAAALPGSNGKAPRSGHLQSVLRETVAWAQAARREGEGLHSDRAAILAWVAVQPVYREAFGAEIVPWALQHLELGPETLPDRLVPGLAAWQRWLGREGATVGCW